MPGGNKNIKPEDGKPFTKNDPRINKKGRPRKLLSTINAELKKKGIERVSSSQIAEAYELFLNLTEDEATEIIEGKDNPMFMRIVLKHLMSPKGVEMIESILDRAHGKSKKYLDHTTQGEKITRIERVIIDPNESKS